MAFGRKNKRKAPQEQDTGFSQQAGAEPQRIRLTPVDVQQKVFRLAFRGYNEQDVDHFLDEITEDLAAQHEENKRLREELELRGPGGGTEDARRHAEEIIRRAREEAARISAAAPAAPVVPVGSAAATPAFLVREREFLQRLAALVQDHAASLKSEARRAREAEEPEEPEQEELEELEPEPSEPEPPEPEESGQPGQEASLGHTAPMPPPQGGGLERSSNPFEGPETDDGEEILDDEEAAPGGEEEPSLRELFWGEE